jgi:hypothetical protein
MRRNRESYNVGPALVWAFVILLVLSSIAPAIAQYGDPLIGAEKRTQRPPGHHSMYETSRPTVTPYESPRPWANSDVYTNRRQDSYGPNRPAYEANDYDRRYGYGR